MFTQRAKGLYGLVLTGQIVLSLLLFAGWAAVTVLTELLDDPYFLQQYGIYALLVVIALIVEAATRPEKIHQILTPDLVEKERLARRQILFVLGFLVLFLVAAKDKTVSRTFLVGYIPSLYALLLASHYFVPIHLSRIFFDGSREERILLVSFGEEPEHRLRLFLEWMRTKAALGLRIEGFLSATRPPQIEGRQEEIAWLGDCGQLEAILRTRTIQMVVLTGIPPDEPTLREIPLQCERHGARLLIVSDLSEKLHHPLTYFTDGGYQFIALREEPLENPLNRLMKRMVDVLMASIALILVLPLSCLVVWLLQRRQSPGPLFFHQERTGLRGERFYMLKFRTMRSDPEPATLQTSHGDPRLYPAGAWLRRYSLDEVPQFWNVLRGEMSIVGPRPHFTVHDETFAPFINSYRIRAAIKPGITGLAQVRGHRGAVHTESDLVKRVESDLFYLENWSLTLDFVIMLKTAWQMLSPMRTAY